MTAKLHCLLSKLCPSGVPYLKIKDTVGVNRGSRLTKSQLSNEFGFEVYHGSKDTPLGKFSSPNAPANTTIVVNTGGIGGVKFLDKPFWCSDGSFWLGHDPRVNSKFLYYCLSGYETYFYSKKRIGGVPTIDRSVIEDFKIPVPPLEVQDEIVRILDAFVGLTEELISNLSAEQIARKKQYEFYRDQVFTQIDPKYMVKLETFADIKRGGNFQKKNFVSKGYPCIHYGQMYTHFGIYTDQVISFLEQPVFNASKKAHSGDIVMAVTSENIEDVCKCVAWLGEEEIAVSGHTAIISHSQNPKFLSYFFHSASFFSQKVKLAHGTKVIEITPSALLGIDVPLPSLEEQERIVRILDKMDSLCSDIFSSLPAEIEARKKQYEFYRDKLLSFEEMKP